MIVTKISSFSGKLNQMDLNVTQEQLDRHSNGELAQNVFPELNKVEREFLISGMSEEEQILIFGTPGEIDYDQDDIFDDEDDGFWDNFNDDLGGTGHGDISYSDADPGL